MASPSPPPPIDEVAQSLGLLSLASDPTIHYLPMPDPLSVYVPLHSLTEKSVQSLVRVLEQADRCYPNASSDTLLAFLLALNQRLTAMEEKEQNGEQTKKIREWLLVHDGQSNEVRKIDWTRREEKFHWYMEERTKRDFSPYHELTLKPVSVEKRREEFQRGERERFRFIPISNILWSTSLVLVQKVGKPKN